MGKAVVFSFVIWVFVVIIIGILRYVIFDGNTLSSLSDLYQATFTADSYFMFAIAFIADLFRIFKERAQKETDAI